MTREDLERRLGGAVTDMVVALSETTEHPKLDWRTRKTRNLDRFTDEDPWVKLVSAADKLHNLQCLIQDLRRHGEKVWDRFNVRKEDLRGYYHTTIEALGKGWEDPLLKELRQAVGDLTAMSA